MDIRQEGIVRGFRGLALALLLLTVVGLQLAYDRVQPASSSAGQGKGLSPDAIRMADLGFHSTIASFMWIATMPEILDLYFYGKTEYLSDRAFLNAVDPKLSYPYAFTVLTLPVVRSYSARVSAALEVGEEGIAQADPDWRIPYYMAIDYYLENKDLKSAIRYFSIAAETPGIPDFARRFSQNFGINQRERDRVLGIWRSIRDTTNDPDMKLRAAAYVERLEDFDAIEAAAKAFKQKYGSYPPVIDLLVSKGFLPAVPQDPFGYTFTINADGTAGIDLTRIPQ